MKIKILIILLAFLLAPATIFAKDYSIPSVFIKALINPDGSVEFQEDRTFNFNDSFSFGYYDLPKQGYETLSGIQVLDNGKPLLKNNSESPGTFFVEEFSNYYRIRYFYSAFFEKKTFTFIFTAKGAVKVYEDYGDFYWKLQGTGWDRSIGDFKAEIEFVKPVPTKDYLIWAHGPLSGTFNKFSEYKAILQVKNVPPNTFVESRVLLPTSYFSEAKIIKGTIKEAVLKEEGKLAAIANTKRFLVKILPLISILTFITLILIFSQIYYRYGLEFSIPKNFIYYREPPSKMPPAIVGSILSFNVFNPSFLQATILDLIRRGIVEMKELPSIKRKKDYTLKLLEDKSDKIFDFEKVLIEEILFDESKEITLSKLPVKIKKHNNRYKSAFDDFAKKISEEVKNGNYFDKKSEKISLIIIVLGIFITFISIPLSGIFHPSFMLLTLTGIMYIFGGIMAIPRRTPKGKEEFDKWMGLKTFLRDFSNLKEYCPQSIVLWEEYLVYATVFGVAKNVLRALKIAIPQITDLENGKIFTSLAVSSGGFTASNINSTFSSLNNALSSIKQVSTSSYSSSSGGGGGFSGGGGGGGGGSGGGVG